MAAAVVHLSVHGRLRRSPEIVSQRCYRPSLLRCRAFKQETGGDDEKPSRPPSEARKRKKGPLYKLKAAMQGLAGSRSAAAEVYGGQYERVVEKAEEIFFSVSSLRQSSIPRPPPYADMQLLYMIWLICHFIGSRLLINLQYYLMHRHELGRYQLSRMLARMAPIMC